MGYEEVFQSALQRARKEIIEIDVDTINNLGLQIDFGMEESIDILQELRGLDKQHSDFLGSHTVVTYPPLDALTHLDDTMGKQIIEKEKLEGEIGLYVHIPFCDYRCTFCAYTTLNIHGVDKELLPPYIAALKKEALTWRERIAPDAKIHSLYIGGGTPTVLDTETLDDLIRFLRDELPFIESPRICVETSPKATLQESTEEQIQMLLDRGVTRSSIGIQTFDPAGLLCTGRGYKGHNVDDEEKAVRILLDKFGNLNVDMMEDLPITGNIDYYERLAKDLLKIAELKPHHVTWYNMRLRPERKVKGVIPSEKDSLTARLAIWNFMEDIGYITYEGDRFFLAECFEDEFRKTRGSMRTNLLGLGVSAYSHTKDLFFQNPRRIGGTLRDDSLDTTRKYIKKVEEKGFATEWGFIMSADEILAGEFALGFKRGVDLKYLFGESLCGGYHMFPGAGVYIEYTNPFVKPLIENGLVEVKDNIVQLTRKGRLWENEICRLYYTPRVIALAMQRRGNLTPLLDQFARSYEHFYAMETNHTTAIYRF